MDTILFQTAVDKFQSSVIKIMHWEIVSVVNLASISTMANAMIPTAPIKM